jgi:hypothetical protein
MRVRITSDSSGLHTTKARYALFGQEHLQVAVIRKLSLFAPDFLLLTMSSQ